jgi:hypothetical protein
VLSSKHCDPVYGAKRYECIGFCPLNCQFLFAGETTFHQHRSPVCRMSAGKRRRQEPIRGSSDSEEEGDSMYDLNWEPEGGSVFKVPPYEFYNTKSEIPGRSKGAHDSRLAGRRSDSLARRKGRSAPTRRRGACYTASGVSSWTSGSSK